jgi:HK97 family phage major capsid protein
MNLMKLQQDRANAFNAAKALHDKAASESRPMTAEELASYNAGMETVRNLDANIAVAKQQLDAERTAPAVPSAQVGDERIVNKPWTLGEKVIAIAKYESSHKSVKDPRLFATATGQNETIDAEGGFNVTPELSADFLQRTFQDDEIARRCDTVPMSSSRLIINGIVDDNRVGGPLGMGVVVARVAEAGTTNFSTIKFRRVELNANKLMAFFKATDELLEDAPAMQSRLEKVVPPALSWRVGNEVLNGTGAGQFLGINTSGVVVVQPKDSAQVAGTITTTNILGMKKLFWWKSRANGVWLVGPDVEAVLETLTIPGQAGTNVALYTPPGVGGNTSKYGMMLGMPVIPVEQTAALGTQGDIMLADFSQYIIGERNGVQSAVSIHVAFLTDEQVFRWTLRNDGQPLWDKPVTQNNSSNKVSPFVVLATRT